MINSALREAFLDALGIVFPVSCAGCGEPDRVLCPSCLEGLTPAVRRFDVEAPGRLPLATWAGLTYEAPLPAVLHAFKESGRTHLGQALSVPLKAAMRAACRALSPLDPFTLVAPPSTRLAKRTRGYVPLDVLARQLHVRTAPLLGSVSARQDQSALGREERWNNLEGTLRAVNGIRSGVRAPGGGSLAGRRIILLDDVATTGATLHECARALQAAGAVVLGAVVVAHTELRVQPLPAVAPPVAFLRVLPPLPGHLPLRLPMQLPPRSPFRPPPQLPHEDSSVTSKEVASANLETSAAAEFFGTLSAKLRDR